MAGAWGKPGKAWRSPGTKSCRNPIRTPIIMIPMTNEMTAGMVTGDAGMVTAFSMGNSIRIRFITDRMRS